MASQALKSSAFACDNCRRKKRKCDASKPTCGYCQRRSKACSYPVHRDAGAVEDRLSRLEEMMTTFVDRWGSPDRRDDPPPLSDRRRGRGRGRGRDDFEPLGCGQDHVGSPEATRARPRSGSSPYARVTPVDGNSSHDWGIDRRYHNSSSYYKSSTRWNTDHRSASGGSPLDQRARLATNATTQRDIEPLVLLMYSVNLPEVPHDLYKYLLDSHWTWIQPLYNMVYRPAFVRDMGDNPEGGQYFSPFLLHAILAHSTRFCRDQPAMAGYEGFSDYFWRKARTMLVEELDKASTVATVQGLLLLSAIENSRGNVSQSWTYSGMAFRMLQDLGIHLDGASQASDGRFSEEDLEVRRRLWWSAFLWDKMISIYFGRTPTLQDSPLAPPTILVDDSTESEPWFPIGAADTSLTVGAAGGVPGVPGHGVSCFVAACRMAEVLHRVLMRHYCDSTARAVVERQDRDLMRDTLALLDDLAPHLRARSEAFAPHHIIVLNCLIHAVIVLAHRPFCPTAGPSPSPAASSAMKACMTSARTINALAGNIRSTYGVCKFAAVGYSLWTAATVFVLDIKSSRPATATDSMSQLDVSRELLNGVAQFCPGIRQAIIALDNQIDHLLPERTRSDDVSGFVDPSAFLPAVPQSQIPVAPVGEASNLVTDFGQAPDLLSELFHSGFLTQTPFQ